MPDVPGITLNSVPDPTQTGWIFKDVAYPHSQMGLGDWRSVSAAAASGEGVENVHLPIRSLFATQSQVNPDFASVAPDPEGRDPFVIKKNGGYYVQDGHHRLTQQAMSGQQTAPVRLLNLDGDTQPAGGLLPLMAPQMVGHPTGLRDRESAILRRFEND